MPELHETDQRLIETLQAAADEWGGLGVLQTAAQMWPDAAAMYYPADPHVVQIRCEREEVIYSDRNIAHVITDPNWSPEPLDYVQRATLAARLRALAEVIDPGTLAEHAERMRQRLGAESVIRP